MRCHVEDVCRRMLIFSRKVLKDRGKRTRCPRQPIVDMDVDCRRPRHDENYSSLFVENSHPETLHRDMCIACSGSSWILPMYLTNFPFISASRYLCCTLRWFCLKRSILLFRYLQAFSLPMRFCPHNRTVPDPSPSHNPRSQEES